MQAQIDEFISRQALPEYYRDAIEQYFLPLADWIVRNKPQQGNCVLGINGAQGTGKSTLAALLKLLLEYRNGWQVAVLSIDDFYLTLAERAELAAEIHPLLQTRGVPGTHDVPLMLHVLDQLQDLQADQSLLLPRFDKSRDDRADESTWCAVPGPLDLVILEGWCVGTMAQSAAALTETVNALEQEQDPSGAWRSFVNDQLGQRYAEVFSRLDKLVFLQAPDFDAIYRWRLEQERKLPDGSAVMDEAEIARFLLHYERLTRASLQYMPAAADVVLKLDRDHRCVASYYRHQ